MKRSLKKRLQTLGLTLLVFVAFTVMFFAYQLLAYLIKHETIDTIHPPQPLPPFPPAQHKTVQDKGALDNGSQ